MTNVIEYSIVRAKKSRIAEYYRNLNSNATVYVSERTAKTTGRLQQHWDNRLRDGIAADELSIILEIKPQKHILKERKNSILV